MLLSVLRRFMPCAELTHPVQVMLSIDGFTQELDLAADDDARVVFVRANETLPPYTQTRVRGSTTGNATEVQKHYYYIATLPGHGVVCCVALKSGCRNMPAEDKRPHSFHYWFDLLVAEGLATPEQQAEFQQKTWKV